MHARIAASLVMAATLAVLAGCASTGERVVANARPFTLAAGEHVWLADGTRLKYGGIVSDSRCRPEVQCVWAGRAEVDFAITPPSRIEGAESAISELLLATDEPAGRSDMGWRYRLITLGRGEQPTATLRVDPDPGAD